MIKIFVSPSCSSCRKVIEWFTEQKIPFETKNIFVGGLTKSDIREILTKSLDGTDEIISDRSNIIKNNSVDIDAMKLNDLIDFIYANPSCLKRPIIVDDSRIQVGYNKDEIRIFISEARRIFLRNCTKENCSSYDTCPDRLAHEKYINKAVKTSGVSQE